MSGSPAHPVRPLSLVLAAAVVVGCAAVSGAGAPQETLRYRVVTEFVDVEASWAVIQGPELHRAERETAGARFGPDFGSTYLAGPAVDGDRLDVDPEMGLLVRTLEPPELPLQRGLQSDWSEVLDSIRVTVERGDDDRTVGGHAAEHRVLRATAWWRRTAPDGSVIPGRTLGTIDLWTAPELPFSWIPYTVGHPQLPHGGAALPFSFETPAAAAYVADRAGSELRSAGLLLRAEVRTAMEPQNDPDALYQLGPGTEREHTVRVEGIETGGPPPDAGELTASPRVSRSEHDALFMSLFTLVGHCADLPDDGDGSFEIVTEGPREWLSSGSAARVFTDTRWEDAYVVAMGHTSPGIECLVLVLPGEAPTPGSYPVERAESTAHGAEDTAIGAYVSGDPSADQIHRAGLPFDGAVTIERVDGDGRVHGSFEIDALGLELDPDYPRRRLDGMRFLGTFQATGPSTP